MANFGAFAIRHYDNGQMVIISSYAGRNIEFSRFKTSHKRLEEGITSLSDGALHMAEPPYLSYKTE